MRQRSAPPLLARPWGLRTRFVMALVVFAIALSASFALLAGKQTADVLYLQTRNRGGMVSSRLAKDVAGALALDDPLEREIRLLVLANRTALDDTRYVQIVHDGETVITSAAEGYTLPPAPPHTDESTVTEHRFGQEAVLDYFSPLPPGPHGPSYVRLGLSLAPIQNEVNQILVNMGWTAVLFCIVGLILGIGLYRRVFGPLNHLHATAQRLGAGDHSARATIQTGDELEEIAAEFNRMAAAIAARTAELQEANARLVRADQAKSDFLATMGHEWKTPLHAMRGYAQLLLEEVDGPLNEAQRDDVEALLGAGNHLLDLIENILHFIHSEHNEEENHLETLNVTELTLQAWNHVRPAARRRRLAFRNTLPPQLLIQGDRTRLKQVLINLLGNAVQYTEAGTITLDGAADDDVVSVSVCDTGVGIDPAWHEHIFEPFQRMGEPGVFAEGLGLGLAVAKRYVDLHGGRLTVSSQPGKGSVFTVTLPRRQPAPTAATGATTDAGGPASSAAALTEKDGA